MKRVVVAILIVLGVGVALFTRAQGGATRVVDFTADVMRPIDLGGDSTALNLLGNVVFYHNGAVITCDSAVRYSNKRMECFKNVIINQDSTYVYGDRADYDGDLNIARVYAPIIKMTDGDATLYTFKFTFNTKTNVGVYDGGGTIRQGDNVIESQRGYYFVDTRQFVCVRDAQLRNEDYKIKTDSLAYNLDNEEADFFTKTYIWNNDGDMLSADRGRYMVGASEYYFTKNSYILTKDQEVWADTIRYNSDTEYAELRNNIQIRDEDNKVLTFGDFAQYWGDREEAMLTKNPSIMSFDPDQDTLYMRSDSMFFYTFPYDHVFDELADKPKYNEKGELIVPIAMDGSEELIESPVLESAEGAEGDVDPSQPTTETGVQDVAAGGSAAEYVGSGEDVGAVASQQAVVAESEIKQQSDAVVAVAAVDTDRERDVPQEKLSKKEKKKKRKKKGEVAGNEVSTEGRDDIGRGSSNILRYDAGQTDGANAGGSIGAEGQGDAGLEQADGSAKERQSGEGVDGVDGVRLNASTTAIDSLAVGGERVGDSLMVADSVRQKDSLQRVFRAYRNVKIYRNDLQAVCDSMVGFTKDSVMYMYIKPVMWNEDNQITAETIEIYVKNEEVDRIVFMNDPFMSSEIGFMNYNQVRGKQMISYFRGGDIYKHDVKGNAQTYYYMQESDGAYIGFLNVECADISFMFEGGEMKDIIYRGEPTYSITPMEMVPPSRERLLNGFSWQKDRRPRLENVFYGRTINVSQREAYMKLGLPHFKKTKDIDDKRSRYARQGVWADRTDVIGDHALKFINSLGIADPGGGRASRRANTDNTTTQTNEVVDAASASIPTPTGAESESLNLEEGSGADAAIGEFQELVPDAAE